MQLEPGMLCVITGGRTNNLGRVCTTVQLLTHLDVVKHPRTGETGIYYGKYAVWLVEGESLEVDVMGPNGAERRDYGYDAVRPEHLTPLRGNGKGEKMDTSWLKDRDKEKENAQ